MTALISTGCATSGDKTDGLRGAAEAQKRLGRAVGDVPVDVREPCVPMLTPGSKDHAIAELGVQVIACDEKRARAVAHSDFAKANLDGGPQP